MAKDAPELGGKKPKPKAIYIECDEDWKFRLDELCRLAGKSNREIVTEGLDFLYDLATTTDPRGAKLPLFIARAQAAKRMEENPVYSREVISPAVRYGKVTPFTQETERAAEEPQKKTSPQKAQGKRA